MTSWRQMPRVYVHYFAHSPPGTCRAEAHPDADDRVRAATTSEIEGPLRLLKPRRSSASYWFNQATCHHKKSGKVQRYVADVRRREHIVERPAGSIYGQRLDVEDVYGGAGNSMFSQGRDRGALVGPLGLFLTFAERDKELNAVIVQLVERKVAVAFAFFAVQLGAPHRMLSCRVFSHDLY